MREVEFAEGAATGLEEFCSIGDLDRERQSLQQREPRQEVVRMIETAVDSAVIILH
jgi:hypothetical protein